MKISVIIPAAGSSTRFGEKNKLRMDLGGRALLLRTVEFFTKREDVTQIIVAGPPDSFEEFQEAFGASLSFHGVQMIQGSSKSRCETIALALAEVCKDAHRIVIHDAARPAINDALFDRLLLASKELHAVAAALPITGTIKQTTATTKVIGDEDAIADSILGASSQSKVVAHLVEKTIDRTMKWELQTPQIFKPSLLHQAYAQSDISDCTDDAQVVEKFGEQVYLVEGDSRNIKVTTPADFQLISSILSIKNEKPRPSHKRF